MDIDNNLTPINENAEFDNESAEDNQTVEGNSSFARGRPRSEGGSDIEDEFDRNVRARANDIDWQVVEMTADHKIPRGYTAVSVLDMMDEHAISMRKVMYLRLLRVKTQHKRGEGFSMSSSKKSNTRTELGSHRLFLCMDVLSTKGHTVYLTFNTVSENKNLWAKTQSLRDGGKFTVGCCFAILAPRPITQKYNNDIPLVYTDGSLILLENKIDLPQVPVQKNTPEKLTRAFSTTARLVVRNVSVIDTKCSGFLCDRQRIQEIQRNQEGCGCFAHSTRLSNMVISFELLVKTNVDFIVSQFSSHRFSNLFLTEPFPDALTWRAFDHNDNLAELINSIESIVEMVNGNGGWIVTGWSKRGEISDMTLSDKENNKKISASEVKHHVTSIDMARQFTVTQSLALNQKKFNIANAS